MQMEWIIGGIGLLIGAVLLKKFQELGAFQVLIRAFTICWATLAAMHLWPITIKGINLIGSGLPPGAQAAAAFWLGFILACVPAVLFIRYWLLRYSTTFLYHVDLFFRWGGALVCAIVVFCLVTMTYSMAAGSTDHFDSRKLKVKVDIAPVQAYVRVAQYCSPSIKSPAPVQERLPRGVQKFLSRYKT